MYIHLEMQCKLHYQSLCGYYGSSKDFYKKISTATDGKCLQLADFANMFDFMMAICYREHDETLLQVRTLVVLQFFLFS
jgi:hypothetical protein